MIVVERLTLCSKFAKNRLSDSAGLRPDTLGSLQDREKEGRGRTRKGRGQRGIPLRIKILAMALLLSTKSSHCKDHRKVPKCPAGTSKSIQPDS